MPLIYNINNATYRPKMAAFDYDWTLVNPREGKTFPTDICDWEWLLPSVPYTIKQLYESGHMIVIFTNQSKAWKYEQIKLVLSFLHIPLFIVIATNKYEYKPNTIMFDTLFENKTINKSGSLYVGDALGRKSDFADTDKLFAENIGVRFLAPERLFPMTINLNMDSVIEYPKQEVIIMVGYPGSGKSTVASQLCKNTKYVVISGDIYKTSSKMIKQAVPFVEQSKSIIFDATNSSAKKRSEYIEFAKKYNLHVRCFYLQTSLSMSFKYNKLRTDKNQVPKIAYSVYSKYFNEPDENEGFVLEKIDLFN